MAETTTNGEKKDQLEAVAPKRISYWRKIVDQAGITVEVENHPYPGSGTEEDPYLISWIPNDPRNPMLFANSKSHHDLCNTTAIHRRT